MTIYRFAYPKYADDLSGTGARIHGGRWNQPGTAILYASWSISLALLEVLANASTLEQLRPIQLVKIEIPEHTSAYEIRLSELQKQWWNSFEYTQWLGSEIMKSAFPFVIKCPSAIIETEFNYLVNPRHESFKKIKHTIETDFRFDGRVFKLSF